MTSTFLTANPSLALPMDHSELDAARALLGVSPSSSFAHDRTLSPIDAAYDESAINAVETLMSSFSFPASKVKGFSIEQRFKEEIPYEEPTYARRPRSDSAGLDALAALASKEQESILIEEDERKSSVKSLVSSAISSSSSSDNEGDSPKNMPPPPSRVRRRRSASNPEGMEKWDSFRPAREGRRHFVLPASILEVELAEANAAVKEQERRLPLCIPEESEFCEQPSKSKKGSVVKQIEVLEEKVDESTLTPEELLRRARSRLLEDLSEGSVQGEKGVLTLPHSLAKYKEVYNQNGRIGIYTPAERAAIIDRFNRKRSRRVWNKKIRYNCRKSLADRRLRVKGRFVKRSEQEFLAKQLAEKGVAGKDSNDSSGRDPNNSDGDNNGNASGDDCVDREAADDDHEMADVRNDPEAGFDPTEDQPYRRLRRYTIT